MQAEGDGAMLQAGEHGAMLQVGGWSHAVGGCDKQVTPPQSPDPPVSLPPGSAGTRCQHPSPGTPPQGPQMAATTLRLQAEPPQGTQVAGDPQPQPSPALVTTRAR